MGCSSSKQRRILKGLEKIYVASIHACAIGMYEDVPRDSNTPELRNIPLHIVWFLEWFKEYSLIKGSRSIRVSDFPLLLTVLRGTMKGDTRFPIEDR